MKKHFLNLLWAVALLLSIENARAFYNPTTGRWLSRDPIEEKGGVNLFAMNANNSISFLDGLGLETLREAVTRGSIRWAQLKDIVITPEETQLVLNAAKRSSEIHSPEQIEKQTMSFWPGMDRINPFSPYNDLKKKFPCAKSDSELFRRESDWKNEILAKWQLFQWIGDETDKMRFRILGPATDLTLMLAMQAVAVPRSPSVQTLAPTLEEGAVRQTFATGKEWYDYFAGKYGAQNVDWVSGSGRTVSWPSELPMPASSELIRVSPVRGDPRVFAQQLEGVAGPRPLGGLAHHVQPLGLNGVDNGALNGAWLFDPAHQAGHTSLNSVVNSVPYGTWIIFKR